jgi:hypothetical protein
LPAASASDPWPPKMRQPKSPRDDNDIEEQTA